MKKEKAIFVIEGMTCINCQNRIERTLKKPSEYQRLVFHTAKGALKSSLTPK